MRPEKKPEPSLQTPVHGPGVMAESDWTPHTIDFTHAPRATVQVFSYVLTHSTRKSFVVYERSDLFALMDGHVASFTRFEGLLAWQDLISDVRVDRARRHPTMDLFLAEAPSLLPLPRHPYDTARVVYRVCSIDGFVAWAGDRYAVPYEGIYDLLPVRVTQDELFVYAADLRLLVRHELAPRDGSRSRDIRPPGVHRTPTRPGADLDQLRTTFADLGEGATEFFAGISRLGTRLCGFHARRILLLRERYTTEDLVSALRHAHSFGAYETGAVERILAARAAPRTLAEYVEQNSAARIEQRLGHAETRPRDLGEYDRLPVVPPPLPKEEPCPENPTPPPTTSSNESDDT